MSTKLDINFTQAADSIRNLGRLFKHMEGAADALQEIGSLDQARKEKQKILADLTAEIDIASEAVKKAHGEELAVSNRIEDSLAAAKNEADAIVAGAKAKAAGITTNAEVLAQARALQAAEDAGKIIAAAKFDAKKLADERADAATKVAELDTEVEAKRAELKQVNDAIAAARATMAKIMGN